MALFSNSSEGEGYFESQCSECIHRIVAKREGMECWIEFMHQDSREFGQRACDLFVPTKDGHSQRCRMRIDRDEVPK